LIAISIFLLIKYFRYRYLNNKIDSIYQDKKDVYDNMLSQYNPYYKNLGPENKDRFLKRVIFFVELKEFKFVGVEEEEQMPVLIAAAAIQLTFGLEHYLLDYFKTIYVMKDNYRYSQYPVPFEGHVSDDGIYLSWTNFTREYKDYSDGQNVGLHEMAH